MGKRKKKNPYPWIFSFNERKFEPFIRAIGQSTLLWNDLHEQLGHLYGIAMGGGFVNIHFRVWNFQQNRSRQARHALGRCTMDIC
jgi:hypothetical protein